MNELSVHGVKSIKIHNIKDLNTGSYVVEIEIEQGKLLNKLKATITVSLFSDDISVFTPLFDGKKELTIEKTMEFI